jgi:hypothetical protein
MNLKELGDISHNLVQSIDRTEIVKKIMVEVIKENDQDTMLTVADYFCHRFAERLICDCFQAVLQYQIDQHKNSK